jgi:hypothetical protein
MIYPNSDPSDFQTLVSWTAGQRGDDNLFKKGMRKLYLTSLSGNKVDIGADPRATFQVHLFVWIREQH